MSSREQSGVVAPKQSRGQETQARLIDACLRLVADRPFEQISVAEIAAEAGVSVGNFYRRFRSKEAILPDLFDAYETRYAAFSEEMRQLEDFGHPDLDARIRRGRRRSAPGCRHRSPRACAGPRTRRPAGPAPPGVHPGSCRPKDCRMRGKRACSRRPVAPRARSRVRPSRRSIGRRCSCRAAARAHCKSGLRIAYRIPDGQDT